ncbi:hypothetical protein FKP32DRAFT_1607160 [Trametes sanguinea]|nr:hypothetical protein FKP32DRAFT_1607160 [Trametes sanguinea]
MSNVFSLRASESYPELPGAPKSVFALPVLMGASTRSWSLRRGYRRDEELQALKHPRPTGRARRSYFGRMESYQAPGSATKGSRGAAEGSRERNQGLPGAPPRAPGSATKGSRERNQGLPGRNGGRPNPALSWPLAQQRAVHRKTTATAAYQRDGDHGARHGRMRSVPRSGSPYYRRTIAPDMYRQRRRRCTARSYEERAALRVALLPAHHRTGHVQTTARSTVV